MSLRLQRTARFLCARRKLVLVLATLAGLAAIPFILRLQVKTNFAELLPEDRASVVDLRQAEARVNAFGTAFLVVESRDHQARRDGALALADAIRGFDSALVSRVYFDDTQAREYFWGHRFLFVDLEQLTAARDGLKEKVREAKLEANPLFIDLGADDSENDADAWRADLEALEAKFDKAKDDLHRESSFVSRNQDLQLVVVQAPFQGSNVATGKKLIAAIEQQTTSVQSAYPVRVGITGDIVTSIAEHDSIVKGMTIAALATVSLVVALLIAYFRSVKLVVAPLVSLLVGCLLTFAATQVLIGELNVASAFLAAIVVGNGINPGLMVTARYLEELRRHEHHAAIARAMSGTLSGTLAASLTAAVAYGALAATEFRGFKHFGVIGGLGMALCWLTAYSVLPAVLAAISPPARARQSRFSFSFLAKIPPRMVVLVTAAIAVVSAVAAWNYITSDPIETDWRNLRAVNSASEEARGWNDRIFAEFERDFNRGLAKRLVVLAKDREALGRATEIFRTYNRRHNSNDFNGANSVDDVWPPHQTQKIAVYEQIRDLAQTLRPEVAPEDVDLLDKLLPSQTLHAVTVEQVPQELLAPFTERDGTVGKLGWTKASDLYETWKIRDLERFAAVVRAIDLPPGTIVAGQSFVFADMLQAMERDIPIASVVVVLGAILCIFLVVGFNKFALLVVAATTVGATTMIAVVALFDMKVNFLDFIALPITIGIGVDYAANLAARARNDSTQRAASLLRSTGGAVALCSATTIIGYGSLLLSENAGIRSFGLASVIGEFTCLAAALLLVPAVATLLNTRRTRARRRSAV